MFRITSHVQDGDCVLKVEGCLTGPSVRVLETSWREAARTKTGGERIRVDLRDVCHVDRDGRELMTVMYRAGVRYLARGCVMPELVKEIAQSAAAKWRA